MKVSRQKELRSHRENALSFLYHQITSNNVTELKIEEELLFLCIVTVATILLLQFHLKRSNTIVNAKSVERATLVTKGVDNFADFLY